MKKIFIIFFVLGLSIITKANDAYVVKATASVLDAPIAGSNSLGVLEQGQTISVLAIDGEWAIIQYNPSMVGFAPIQSLEKQQMTQQQQELVPSDDSEFASVPVSTPSDDSEFASAPVEEDADSKSKGMQGGLEISLNGWENVGGVNLAFTGKWWFGEAGVAFAKKTAGVKESIGFRIGLGTHYRFNATKWLYLDGRIGGYYSFYKIETQFKIYDKTETNTMKSNAFLLTFRPCIGFNLFKIKGNDFSIFAAYEGQVSNFKSYGNNWSVGICFGY